MPGRAVPWPVKANAGGPCGAGGPVCRSSREAASSSAVRPTAVAREARWRLPHAKVAATSATGSSGSFRSRSPTRPASSSSASGSRADTGTRNGSPGTAGADGGGGSSSTTWALVPPTPSALTPALRGTPSGVVHGRSSVARTRGPPSRRSSGLGRVRCSVGTRVRWRSIRTVFRNPAIPAQLSRWPILGFTEPTVQNPLRPVPSSSARPSASSSTGSPSGVPVPWASTYEMVSAGTSALRRAWRTTSTWPATPGALKPALPAPSLLTAEPRMTACTGSPSASAWSSRLSSTAATPLPPTVPSASASKARQRPVGDRTDPGWPW